MHRPSRGVAGLALVAFAGLPLGAAWPAARFAGSDAAGTPRAQAPVAAQVAQPPARASATTGRYPVNAQGQTYGSAAGAESPQDMPDLIAAYATNGALGYVTKADFLGRLPKNPQEAVQMRKEQDAAAQQRKSADHPGGARQIPVYRVDGVTSIGTSNVG